MFPTLSLYVSNNLVICVRHSVTTAQELVAASLVDANLVGANLEGADLTRVSPEPSIFNPQPRILNPEANLIGVNLGGAD